MILTNAKKWHKTIKNVKFLQKTTYEQIKNEENNNFLK